MKETKCLKPSDNGSRIGDRSPSRTASSAVGSSGGRRRSPIGRGGIHTVIVEDGFQDGLQMPFDDFLCASVADRWDAQRPGPAIALGKVNPPHWPRKVAP